ncbi:MAG: transglycosylase SLT domain-containing protein [Nitrospirae bacterium]|nr:transglycosylase SLT domain-containing protein [Nitrospirota bacterium]
MKRLSYIFLLLAFLLSINLPAVASEEKISQESQPADLSQKGVVLQAPPLITPYADNQTAARAVDRNISLFANRIKDRFALYLSRSGKYIDIMQNILRKKDVPEDIVFLSLIESGFSTNAYSIAHAAGPWQFIASTAKRYGLEIDWWKDERRDPVKSTEAAADYLKDLHGMFGSWNLAMAAYNAGEGKIMRAMKRSNADDYWDLLGTKHIRAETKEYVPRFIAASMIASNPEEFGFEAIEYQTPLSYDEVEIGSPIDLSVVAECAGITLDEVKRLNPELRRWCTPPDAERYILKIPEGSRAIFLEKLNAVPAEERFTIDRYTVKKGDTFKSISNKTGMPVPVILSLNSMEKIMPLKAGSTIYLPPKDLFSLDNVDRALMKKASYKKKVKISSGSKKKAFSSKASVKKISARKTKGKQARKV